MVICSWNAIPYRGYLARSTCNRHSLAGVWQRRSRCLGPFSVGVVFTLYCLTVISSGHKSSRRRMKAQINPLMASGSCPSSWKKESAPAIAAEQDFRAPSFPAIISLCSLHRLDIYGNSCVLLQLENLLVCYPIQDHSFKRNLQGHHVHFQLKKSSTRLPLHKCAQIHLTTTCVFVAITDTNRR